MKVAVEWLRSFGEFSSLDDKQLADTLTMAGLEVEEVQGGGSDTVFVTKVTPNRGDWLSIFGVARELSAASALPLHIPTPLHAYPVSSAVGDFTVDVVDVDLCPRFGAAIMHEVRHVPSPPFIQERLLLSGMRPLNAIVDITNYVMLEIGQPLHAYDLDELSGRKLIVRRGRTGETLKTLDGAEHELSGDLLVIADGNAPVGIAGIMGGLASEVTESTTTIVLEAAHFDPGIVRRGAKMLGFSTEASYRFERFVDSQLVPIAIARAVELLTQFAGAVCEPTIIDSAPMPPGRRSIRIRTSRTNRILGTPLKTSQIADTLRRLGMGVLEDENESEVLPPTFRPDVVKEIDLIEEVGRMVGYWNLPESLPRVCGEGGSDFPHGQFDSRLRQILVGQGMIETYSHTLGAISYFDDPMVVNSHRVTVRSSLSNELSGLRLTLLPHLLDALALNLRHGQPMLRLFEVGKVFAKTADGEFSEPRHLAGVLCGGGYDYSAIKGIIENLMAALRIEDVQFAPEQRWAFHPGRIARLMSDGIELGYVGELDPFVITEHLELPPATGRIAAFELDAEALRELADHAAVAHYAPLPKFPSVTRDIALIYDSDIPFSSIETVAKAAELELLEAVSLLSVYFGEGIPAGKKSVAIRLSLRSNQRTLAESDAERVIQTVRSSLISNLNATQR